MTRQPVPLLGFLALACLVGVADAQDGGSVAALSILTLMLLVGCCVGVCMWCAAHPNAHSNFTISQPVRHPFDHPS